MSEKKTVSFADNVEVGSVTGDEKEHRRFLKRIAEGDGATFVDDETNGEAVPAKIPRLDDPDEEISKKKHTLDSDEEEEDDHKRMDTKKIEGQEDGTMDFDENIKITPFNMKEDEEEGHFDEAGNFIFDRNKEDVKDAWLDNIDWAFIKKKAGEHWEKFKDEGEEDLTPTLNDARRKEIFKRLVELLKPDQTVTKALSELRRAKNLTPAEERKLRWAAKKEGKTLNTDDGQKLTAELSSLADELISAGHMDAYEWNREKVEFNLQRLDNVAADEVDMFSDEPAPSSSTDKNAQASLDDEVMWEYKESADAKIEGPFTSQIMADRQAEGKLEAKGLARKVGSSEFNPVARIDFDLYC